MTGAAWCRYCSRVIKYDDGRWVDPSATGDDSLWRETCDSNDTFVADHEPGAVSAGDVLSGVSDRDLLAAIRRGDVSPVAGAMPRATGWQRDDAMRGEAKRRGIL